MQNLENKSTFHEIKNQLSVCDLYLEIIKKTLHNQSYENKTVDRAIGIIENSLRSMESSMKELKAQYSPLKIQTINFKMLVDEVFAACESYKNGKNIEFLNELYCDAEILADRDKMYSILINLCKNAIEAIDSKGYVKISSSGRDFFIENNGEAIPQEIQDKLFDDGFTTKSEGSGLGLMLVKNYLNSQNYDIKLLCSDSEKTVFVLCYKN